MAHTHLSPDSCILGQTYKLFAEYIGNLCKPTIINLYSAFRSEDTDARGRSSDARGRSSLPHGTGVKFQNSAS